MSDQVFVSQTELICAILGNLDQQYPGAIVNQAVMNTIIEAATRVMLATNAGGLTLPDKSNPA